MTTPTPGDLSARHVEALRELRDSGDVSDWRSMESALDAAIAALSALPAAGGEWRPIASVPRDGTRVVVWMPDGTFSSASYSAHSEPQGVYWMIPTTPQPSAANHPDALPDGTFSKSVMKRLHVLQPSAAAGFKIMRTRTDGLLEPADAAVGAQGDGYAVEHAVDRFLAWPLPKDFGPDCGISFTPLGHPNGWPSGTNLLTAAQAKAMFQHCLAAPAAGKGVDDVLDLATQYGDHSFGSRNRESWEFDTHGLKQFAAALTRQPVAEDGMVLVPREPLSDDIRAMQQAQFTYTHGLKMERAYAALVERYAAPAATPTDGGEGS